MSTHDRFTPLAQRMEALAKLTGANVIITRVTDTDVIVAAIAGPAAATFPAGDAVPRGDREQYCEYVVRQDSSLFVRDARADEQWNDNPDVDQDLVNYLGYPIHGADGRVFGTACYVDSSARDYSADERMQLEALAREAEMLVQAGAHLRNSLGANA